MDTNAIRAKFPTQLAHAFKIWQSFNITNCSTDFCNHKVKISCFTKGFNSIFYFISDMGHYLYCLSHIVATTFFIDNALIDATGCYIVSTSCLDISKTFIVTKVEVSFVTVNCHITFTMLIGVKCSRVNIQIRVKLLNSNTITACYKQIGERC